MRLVTDAIVLHRAEYRDYDRMVTLFSPTMGRVDAVMRGCRRANSALAGAGDLFCAGEYELNYAKERYTVVQCAVKDVFYPLREDLSRLTHASYCLSLADAAALAGQGAEDVFHLLLKALTFLCYADLAPAMLSSAFEMRYMPMMGYLPSTEQCVVCGCPVDGACRFDAELGGVVCLKCPSRAPAMSAGARRIVMRAPKTDYASVPKLAGHANWPEAARLYRPFVAERIARRTKMEPELPEDEEAGANAP